MDLPIPAIAHTCGIQITVHDKDLSYLDKPYSFKYLHDLSNVENDHGNDDSFAVLIPRDSHLVTIFIDGGGGTTFQQCNTGHMFRANEEYSLRTLCPPNTILHGLVYYDKHDKVKIGIFDLSVMDSVNFKEAKPLQGYFEHGVWQHGEGRHEVVHRLSENAKQLPFVKIHWMGFRKDVLEHACRQELKQLFDYDIAGMGVLWDRIKPT